MLQKIVRRAGGAFGVFRGPGASVEELGRRPFSSIPKDQDGDGLVGMPKEIKIPEISSPDQLSPQRGKPRIGVVGGAGNLGSQVVAHLQERKEAVLVSTRSPDKMRALQGQGVKAGPTSEILEEADIVVILTKPDQVEGVAREASEKLKRGALVMCGAATVPVETIRQALGRDEPVILFMTTLSLDFVCLHAPDGTPEAYKKAAENVFKGKRICWLNEEQLHWMVSIGCFPGVGYDLFNPYLEAAEKIGIPKELIRDAVLLSMKGMGEQPLRKSPPDHFDALYRKVATPGGITEGIAKELKDQKVPNKVGEAFKNGAQKCVDKAAMRRQAAQSTPARTVPAEIVLQRPEAVISEEMPQFSARAEEAATFPTASAGIVPGSSSFFRSKSLQQPSRGMDNGADQVSTEAPASRSFASLSQPFASGG